MTLLLITFFTPLIFATELGNLTPGQLITLQKSNNALVIDIRTEKEWASTGTIPDSHKLQFFSAQGQFDAKKWLADVEQLKSSEDQAIILVCRSGGRSGKVGHLLTQQLEMKNIYHLSNGMMSWIKTGHKIVKNCESKLACK